MDTHGCQPFMRVSDAAEIDDGTEPYRSGVRRNAPSSGAKSAGLASPDNGSHPNDRVACASPGAIC